MLIYLITNKINGKRYVGQTRNPDPMERFKQHAWECKRSHRMPLHYAMKKYGSESFSVELLEKVVEPEDLDERESHYIQSLDTLVPNGYNLVYRDNKGALIRHPKVTRKHSKMMQGNGFQRDKVFSMYTGVTRGGGKKTVSYACTIRKDNVTYCGTFKTDLEAGEAYDIMALSLYGLSVNLNFPEKVDRYTLEDIMSLMAPFLYKGTQDYKHVWWDKGQNKWIAVIKVEGKPKRRFFVDQIDAVEHIDMVKYYYLQVPVEDLVFPDKIEQYLKVNKESLFRRMSTGQGYRWVYPASSGRGFEACFSYQGKRLRVGFFTDAKIAYEAVVAKRLELGLSIV